MVHGMARGAGNSGWIILRTGAVLLATLPSTGMTPMTVRLLKRHPLSTLSGMLRLNSYEWIRTAELAQDLFLNPKTEIDIVAFHRQLVNETVELAFSLMFPFARVNPLKTPILVISSEKDRLSKVNEQERTAKKYSTKSIVIKNQPHNLMMESAWKQVADLIDNWIANELKLP